MGRILKDYLLRHTFLLPLLPFNHLSRDPDSNRSLSVGLDGRDGRLLLSVDDGGGSGSNLPRDVASELLAYGRDVGDVELRERRGGELVDGLVAEGDGERLVAVARKDDDLQRKEKM